MTLRDTADDPQVVTQLRRRRAGFDEIAKHLHLTREQVIALYEQALRDASALARESIRSEELMLADDAVRDLLAIARNHDPSARTAVEAWNAIRAWSEHKARLAGIVGRQAQQQETPPGRINALRATRRA